MKTIDCLECKQQSSCCSFGAWVDLEEAKKISTLGLKGIFIILNRIRIFLPAIELERAMKIIPVLFSLRDGLCVIHKVDYSFKPAHCKEFPYENGKLSPMVDSLCSLAKSKKNKEKTK